MSGRAAHRHIQGVIIPKDSSVMVLQASANRDERVTVEESDLAAVCESLSVSLCL